MQNENVRFREYTRILLFLQLLSPLKVFQILHAQRLPRCSQEKVNTVLKHCRTIDMNAIRTKKEDNAWSQDTKRPRQSQH